MNELRVTTFEELKTYGGTSQVVELPPFADGKPLIARISPPSVLRLASQGKFPNELLIKAAELFVDGNKLDTEDPELLSGVFGVMEVMAQASLVEPTYDEIKKAGLELTDPQLMFLWNYSQKGVAALESFRYVKARGERTNDIEVLPVQAE